MFYTPGESTKPTPVEQPTVSSPTYKHALVDSSYVPRTSLLHNVSGQPIKCDYYRQYQGGSEEPLGLQLDDVATYQSYTLIKGLIYKRDGSPSKNWNPEKYEVSQTWMGNFIFDLIPLEGDMFIQDIGDGRAGLVQLTKTPEPLTVAMDKVYSCECTLLEIMNEKIQANLDSKVVNTLVFSSESALKGGQAVIKTETSDLNKRLAEWSYLITQHLLTEHYWNVERSIRVKDGDGGNGYDPHLVEFLQKVIPPKDRAGLTGFSSIPYEIGSSKALNRQLTIWDCFIQGDFKLLPMLSSEYYVYPRSGLLGTRYLPGFVSTRYDWILLPEKIDYVYNPAQFIYRGGYFGLQPPTQEPVVWNYYFSPEFYAGTYSNEFERFCVSFFKDRVIDRKTLLAQCEAYPTWNEIDQLYRAGVLLTAIMVSKRVIGD